MGTVRAGAGGFVAGPPARVYEVLADYARHRPKILPAPFVEFAVDEGGVGAGTVFRFRMIAGGRNRRFRMKVDEPEPGRVLRESDLESSLVTTFTVEPEAGGSRVTIETGWTGAGGIGGFFERLFAPRALRRIYREELEKLDGYVRGLGETDPGLLGILEAADDASGTEHPAGFDRNREMTAVREMIPELQAIAGRPFSIDEHVEDASYLTQLSIVDEEARPRGGILSNTVLGVRFSNFGKLFTTLSTCGEDRRLPEATVSRVIEHVAGRGYRYVKAEDLEAPYTGNNPHLKGRTWWIRFFDHL